MMNGLGAIPLSFLSTNSGKALTNDLLLSKTAASPPAPAQSPGVPTWVWAAVGFAVIGGGVFYYKHYYHHS